MSEGNRGQISIDGKHDIPLWEGYVRAFMPLLFAAPLAVYFLPWASPEGGFLALEWYQQFASLCVFPALVWSLHRFNRIHKEYHLEPEECVDG